MSRRPRSRSRVARAAEPRRASPATPPPRRRATPRRSRSTTAARSARARPRSCRRTSAASLRARARGRCARAAEDARRRARFARGVRVARLARANSTSRRQPARVVEVGDAVDVGPLDDRVRRQVRAEYASTQSGSRHSWRPHTSSVGIGARRPRALRQVLVRPTAVARMSCTAGRAISAGISRASSRPNHGRFAYSLSTNASPSRDVRSANCAISARHWSSLPGAPAGDTSASARTRPAASRVVQRDRAAERVADDDRRLVEQRVERAGHRREQLLHGQPAAELRREPVPRQVRRDEPRRLLREPSEQRPERRRRRPDAVQHDNGGASPPPRASYTCSPAASRDASPRRTSARRPSRSNAGMTTGFTRTSSDLHRHRNPRDRRLQRDRHHRAAADQVGLALQRDRADHAALRVDARAGARRRGSTRR